MNIDAVTVEIDVEPTISFAMAHNRIAVVRAVRVTNHGAELRGAKLMARVDDLQGQLSVPFEQVIDLPMETDLTLDKLGLRLDPRAMFQVESRRPGQLVVAVEVDGEVMGEARKDVDVLAGMQWVASAEHPGLSLEMLAAHVMPNSPEVADVLTAASARLAAGTGSPSLERDTSRARSGSTPSSRRSTASCSHA